MRMSSHDSHPAPADAARASGSLQAVGLGKTFGRRAVVQDVSLSVDSGEVVGLLGPNGAGKTTSFYMIVGIIPADAGRIEIDGTPITGLPMHRRARMGLSYLPQDASVFRRLTVEENMAFYADLFGWSVEEAGEEYGGYITFRLDGRAVAGLGPVMGDGGGNAWLTYLLVEDAETSEKAALQAGAQLVAPTMTVGEQGRMAVIADPGGAAIGLWDPEQHRGFDLVAEAGAPSWHELYALSYAAQVDFYTRVFGWRTQVLGDTADFRYVTFGDSESPAGGVYDADGMLPPGVPSHWVVYFGVADAAAASQRVVELGGIVVRDPWDSEFGRFAQVTDPLGGLFFLHETGSGSAA